jgi:hypothetical protein
MAPVVWTLGRFASHEARAELSARRLLVVTVLVTLVSLLAAVVAVVGHPPASLSQLFPRHG